MQIAVEKFSEATVGYRGNRQIAEKWVQLFSTPYFLVTAVSAVHTLFRCTHIVPLININFVNYLASNVKNYDSNHSQKP